jgi:hypothetical protein
MVDYFSLIAPSIEPLADAPPEERRVVYDRLIRMLDAQLRAADPPRSDKDILKERINLEAAIRRVERRILSGRKTTAPDPTPSIPTSTSWSAERADTTFAPSPEVPPSLANRQPTPADKAPLSSFEDASDIPEPRLKPGHFGAARQALPVASAPVITAPPMGFEEAAAAELPPPPHEDHSRITEAEAPPLAEQTPTSLPKVSESSFVTNRETLPPYSAPRDFVSESEARQEDTFRAYAPALEGPQADNRPAIPSTSGLRMQRYHFSEQTKGLWLRIGIIALVILALGAAIAGLADYLGQKLSERSATHVATQDQPVSDVSQKITDRLPAEPDDAQAATDANGANAAASTVAQTKATNDADSLIQNAILLEEPPGGIGEPRRWEGKVSWKLDTLKSVVANASDIGARATIDLGDAGLGVTIVFRRNRDPSSANAHLVEVTFTPTADNTNGKVRDISVPELRPDEKTRGASLTGIAVPVSDNAFLIGLSGLAIDSQRNLDLLSSRNWILIPLRYANGKRALLLFEKGKPGERVFADAMQTWK